MTMTMVVSVSTGKSGFLILCPTEMYPYLVIFSLYQLYIIEISKFLNIL